mgnify:CR=1 FL=1
MHPVEDLLGNFAHNTNRKALAETGNSNRERDRRLGRPFVRQNVDDPGGILVESSMRLHNERSEEQTHISNCGVGQSNLELSPIIGCVVVRGCRLREVGVRDLLLDVKIWAGDLLVHLVNPGTAWKLMEARWEISAAKKGRFHDRQSRGCQF